MLPIVAADTLGTAAITAAAALLGSAVGGFVTYKIEKQRQRSERYLADESAQRESELERQRVLAVARGVARVWAAALESYASTLAVTVKRGMWLNDATHHLAQLGTIQYEDRKLIASELTEDQWETIKKAESNVYASNSMRFEDRNNAQISGSAYGPDLSAPKRAELQRYVSELREAQASLQELSKLRAST